MYLLIASGYQTMPFAFVIMNFAHKWVAIFIFMFIYKEKTNKLIFLLLLLSKISRFIIITNFESLYINKIPEISHSFNH